MQEDIVKIVTLLTVLGLFNASSANDVSNRTFGECVPGKESCKECYLTLKKELLTRDDNVFVLSNAFFPPDTNPPEFVKVTYVFMDDEVINKSETWFWVQQSSYFLFPPNTFQFLSLFFGKPEKYYSQQVDLTLSASDCLGVGEQHMSLLTQRLKAFIQRSSFDPVLDNTYVAKAGRDVHDILNDNLADDILNIIYAYQTFVFFLAIMIMSALLAIGNYHAHWFIGIKNAVVLKNRVKQNEALTISIASISFISTVYVLILDIIAASKYTLNPTSPLSGKLHHIAIPVLVIDIVFFLVSFVCGIIFFCASELCCKIENQKCMKKVKCNEVRQFLVLLAIITFAIIELVIHAPFIAIAFLNDPYHAGSILIFYVVSFILLLAVFEVIYVMGKRLMIVEKTFENIDIIVDLNNSQLNTSINPNTDSEIDCQNPGTEQNQNNGQNDLERNQNNEQDKWVYLRQLLKVESAFVESADLTLRLNRAIKGTLKNVTFILTEECEKLKSDVPNAERVVYGFTLALLVNNIQEIVASGECEHSNLKITKDDENNKVTVVFKRIVIKDKSSDGKKESGKKKEDKCTIHIFCVILSLILLLLFTLVGIVFTASYLVLIPINRSISDGPNRLIGVYQTLFLFVGVYVAYKTFFKRKISLHSVVANSKRSLSKFKDNDEWSSMSNEERIIEFYQVKAEAISGQARGDNHSQHNAQAAGSNANSMA